MIYKAPKFERTESGCVAHRRFHINYTWNDTWNQTSRTQRPSSFNNSVKNCYWIICLPSTATLKHYFQH